MTRHVLLRVSYLLVILFAVVLATAALPGCSAGDPLPDTLYVNDIQYTRNHWDNLRTPTNALRLPSVNPPVWTAAYGGSVLSFEYQAVGVNEEEVYLSLQLPHTWVEGSDVYPHLHFAFSTNTVGDVARWGLEYTWTNIGSAIQASDTIYANTRATNNDADTHYIVDFPVISGSGMNHSSVMIIRLFRNSSNAADTYADNIRLLEVDMHYLVNKPGSDSQY